MKLLVKAIPAFLILIGFAGFVFYKPREQNHLSFALGTAFGAGIALLVTYLNEEV